MSTSALIAAFTIDVDPVGQPGGFAPTSIKPAQTHADDLAAQATNRAKFGVCSMVKPELGDNPFGHVSSASP